MNPKLDVFKGEPRFSVPIKSHLESVAGTAKFRAIADPLQQSGGLLERLGDVFREVIQPAFKLL